jgi:phage terminase large subunit-like protein
MVFALPNNVFVAKQHSFMPEDKLQERIKSDRVPFDMWEKDGHLTTTPGSIVDYSFVEQKIVDWREYGYQIQEVDYDKWNASHFAQNLDLLGFTTVEIPQMLRHLSLPTKDFRKLVYKGNIIHFDDPLLTWAIGNAITKMDAQENIMLDKSKSKDRIDPIAAIINAFSRAMSGEVEQTVDFNKRFMSNKFSF